MCCSVCSVFLSDLLFLGTIKLLEDDLLIKWPHFSRTWGPRSTSLWQTHTGPALTSLAPSLRSLWLGKVHPWIDDCISVGSKAKFCHCAICSSLKIISIFIKKDIYNNNTMAKFWEPALFLLFLWGVCTKFTWNAYCF